LPGGESPADRRTMASDPPFLLATAGPDRVTAPIKRTPETAEASA
jgi:hypothetical protein